jgi:RNA polymerase sigma-70 factor (ECF subfamily)
VDYVDRHAQLDSWFRVYGDRVLAYLLHRTDPETAQDVLQEVFVTAFRKAPQVPDPPIGWLFGTARRLLANARRGAQRRDHLVLRIAEHRTATSNHDDDSGVLAQTWSVLSATSPWGGSAGDVVAQALAQLSERDREVLTLSAWYELSADEAAQALGCSRSAYSVRLHRARHRLADRLRAAGYRPHSERQPEAAHD